jgi:YD repeat-containing protein
VDYSYDDLGRPYTVTNPHRSASWSTDGTTTNHYDALNRTIEIDRQDGSAVYILYCGSSTLTIDEAGKWRRSITDGLGRLKEVSNRRNLQYVEFELQHGKPAHR